MKTSVLSQANCTENKSAKKIIAVIGRWMPFHIGHKRFSVKLAKDENCEKIIFMIGSCYEGGDPRFCITAAEREKMIRAVMKRENIPEGKYDIVPVPDFPTFEEWITNVLQKCKEYKVTHFCTGNKEDILDVLESRNEKLDMEIINPEIDSDFPYHATDIRNMIIKGEYEKLEELIPNEIKPILFRYTFKEILAVSKNRGIHFIEGRQTVDMILLVRNINDGKVYVLLGNRPEDKEEGEFPGALAVPGGGIRLFETATNAAIRKFYDETGLKIKMLDNSLEPAIVKFEDMPNSNLEQMHIVGIYGTQDKKANGTKGGSSQCFAILVEGDLKQYQDLINPQHGLTNVKFYDIEKISRKPLAFQQNDMLKKAINMLEAYPDLQKAIPRPEKKKETFVISFVGASGVGKSTAALGTTYELKKMAKSVEYVDEFAKRLVYSDLLEKYIPNQSYIISEQYKVIYDLQGKVDYIVSDAGLEISALHSSGEKVIEDLAWYLTKQINQFTILIERDTKKVKFEENGRVEDEEESRSFGEKLEEYLKSNGVRYVKVKGSDAAVEMALKVIAKREEEQSKQEK
ncbi:MAG: NUDIX domain-containing protein [Clostridia bacterium]|nr:NUDIX domain-containing protein [Clostridia bacterium]